VTARDLARALGPLHPRSHELFLGVPGSGKTHHARARLRTARRCVFFDPTGHDYETEGERVRVADLGDPDLWAGQFVRLVVVPGADVPGDFSATVAACRTAGGFRPLVLCADEVGDYSARCADDLTRLHRNGHHDGVASLLVSQCAVDIPKTCRRTATRVCSLLQTASADLDALETEYGAEFAERVRRWRPGDSPAVWTLPTLHPPRRKEGCT
jgi:hypothetical protein